MFVFIHKISCIYEGGQMSITDTTYKLYHDCKAKVVAFQLLPMKCAQSQAAQEAVNVDSVQVSPRLF